MLYEMLTGRAIFGRDTITDTLAAIVEREPDWKLLPPATPASARYVLRRCLEKDPRQRLRDVGEARFELTVGRATIASDHGSPGPTRTRARTAWAAAAAVIALAGALLTLQWFVRRDPSVRSDRITARFSVAPPGGGYFMREPATLFLAISPDGSQLAFVAAAPGTRSRIWLRAISGLDAREVPGSEGGKSPFWSPDGQFLAFFADGYLKRIDVNRGSAVPVVPVPDAGRSHGTWGSEGTILIGSSEGKVIFSVSATGGPLEPIVQPARAAGETRVHWPHFLPDGRRFLYLTRSQDGSGELRVTERGGSPRRIATMVSNVQWVDPDYLLFVREGVLVGQRFDLSRERLVGDPFSVAEPVEYIVTIGRGMFTASRSGTIAYHSHRDESRLVWSDRMGNEVGALEPPGSYQNLRISPDGRSALFSRAEAAIGTGDLWTVDLTRGAETRLTSDRGSEVTAVWLPSGRAIAFGSDRGGATPHLYRKDLVTGAEDELRPAGLQQQAMDASPDGKALAFLERSPDGNFNAFLLPLANPASSSPLLVSRFSKVDLRFAPDGRAIAYVSNDGGRFQVYVAPYPAMGPTVTVSSGGGGLPRWSRNGRELFYVSDDSRVMAVPIRTTPSLEVAPPVALFKMGERKGWHDFDVSADGRFLSVVSQTDAAEQPLTVIVNWTAERTR